MKKETRKRTQKFVQGNRHCDGPRDVKWSVKADQGWEIDVESINVTPTVLSSKSIYRGVTEATSSGFNIAGQVINSGSCVKVFGNVVAKDGRGTRHVDVTYNETRMVPAN